MNHLKKTLSSSAAAARAPLSHFKTHCGPMHSIFENKPKADFTVPPLHFGQLKKSLHYNIEVTAEIQCFDPFCLLGTPAMQSSLMRVNLPDSSRKYPGWPHHPTGPLWLASGKYKLSGVVWAAGIAVQRMRYIIQDLDCGHFGNLVLGEFHTWNESVGSET